MADAKAFRAGLERSVKAAEHAVNLKGLTRTKCKTCGGTGYRVQGRTECDAHGSYYVPADPCRACCGVGLVDVPCGQAKEVAAIKKEIVALKARLKALGRAVKGGDNG